MKNTLIIISLFITSLFYAQGMMNMFNFSDYDMQGRLVSKGTQSCYPIVWGSYKLPARTQFKFEFIKNSQPYFETNWGALMNYNGTTSSQNYLSPLLNVVLPNVITWDYSWFTTFNNGIATGDNFWMGDPLNTCSSNPITDYQQGNFTDALWFVLNGETYLIVQ
jgi:hypothetical protein